jgi:hypothetical protein
VRGPTATQQLGGACVAYRSPRGVAPAWERPVRVVGRGARGSSQALGEEGPTPRRAGAWPPRAH